MRDANWDEIFYRRAEPVPTLEERRLQSFLPWEDWLTFLITTVCFLSVVHSIDSADWVAGMPSLYPVGFSALLAGYALSRIRIPELLIHPVALLIGAALVYLQLMAIVPGDTIPARTDALLDRMYTWWSAATQEGISSDTLPFIVFVLVLLWAGAYFSTWAIFRWRNAWLALIPGGIALMWNISFIPGQFSQSFVVFLFGAVLLLMRLHVAHKETEWEARGVAYPEFLSLSVLNVTFWVTVGLLVAVLLLPPPDRSETASERWDNFTVPLTSRFAPLSRVFISVNAKKPIDVHNLEGALALQGKITLNSDQAVDINVEVPQDVANYLRTQSFDEYTATGWKVNIEGGIPLSPGDRTSADAGAVEGARRDVTVNVTVEGSGDDFVYSLGQPLGSSWRVEAEVGEDDADITSLKPRERLRDGDTYTVTGTIVVASVEQLRAAGEDYPAWTERYLQLPDRLPGRVGLKAREVTRGVGDTPYDQAIAVQEFLRTFPNNYKVDAAPPGRDSVDYFLFDLQEGYFDYHASAMAVMLRTLGIPARVAVGYVIDPLQRDPQTPTAYSLTEKQAFTWPEVYFPGVGWVEFNPAPTQPRISRPGTTVPAPQSPDSPRGTDEFSFEDLPLAPGGPTDPIGDFSDGGGRSGSWIVLLSLAIAGAAVVALGAAGRLAWEFGMGSLTRPAQLWEKTLRLSRWARAGARPSETPREFAARLRDDVPQSAGIDLVAGAYERSAFGRCEPTEDEAERLEASWRSLRNILLRRILRLPSRP
ncbi:MAG: transglutaminase domain-containing protein [Dehalococcoidia bacterium]